MSYAEGIGRSNEHFLVSEARDLMAVMVETSQRPAEKYTEDRGNIAFIERVGDHIEARSGQVRIINDPEYNNRGLLVVEAGDPNGEQVLAGISHSDVVGVDDQVWKSDPWKLHETDGKWYGRGVCDTHGSGVAMVIAALQPTLDAQLRRRGKRISIVFTSDEEAPEAYWSYRGAKLAVGDFGVEETAIQGKYFIAGEPTETEKAGVMIARRAHKGRWLARYGVEVAEAGHSAENVQNALSVAIDVAHGITDFAQNELKKSRDDKKIATIFDPPYSTAQITGGDIKNSAFSTTPDQASFVVDLRTLPGSHNEQRSRLQELIQKFGAVFGQGISLSLEEIDSFAGTITDADSPIVVAATKATKQTTLGFNGGDEGEVMRNHGKEGITLGPGKLSQAHTANEHIQIKSVVRAIRVYSKIFSDAVNF